MARLRQVEMDIEEEAAEHDALPSPEDYWWDSARGWGLKRASHTDLPANETCRQKFLSSPEQTVVFGLQISRGCAIIRAYSADAQSRFGISWRA